jgi:hypothetical protein
VVELLAPQHAGEGLALNPPHILIGDVLLQGGVECVRLGDALGEDLVEADEGVRMLTGSAQPQSNGDAAAGRNRAQIESGRLGAVADGAQGIGTAVHEILVKGILEGTLRSAKAE